MPEPQREPSRRTPALPDEEALVARAVAGDRSAFARLVDHYQAACYGVAWRLLGDADLAADATQDAFLHAYRAMARYRGGIFRSWLLRITANASYDILRHLGRHPTTAMPEAEQGERELPDRAAADPVEEVTRGEMYQRLDLALAQLPVDQRVAVVLCDVYGMDYGQVAQITQAAIGTVKSRIHRGRLHLRTLLMGDRELFER